MKDGRLMYTLHGEDDEVDVVYSVSIFCSTTEEKVQPGATINRYDVWTHAK